MPQGTYLIETLYLKSNGSLNLEAGAVLQASPTGKITVRRIFARRILYPLTNMPAVRIVDWDHDCKVSDSENVSFESCRFVKGSAGEASVK